MIFQDGVNEINDMDFIIVQMGMSKKHVKEKYGVNVDDETESDPQSRGGRSTAEDVVTVNFGYFRNEKGGIGRYTWVNDMELEDLEDYQARKMKRCTKCGADMTGWTAVSTAAARRRRNTTATRWSFSRTLRQGTA